ncbi:hypothetical protein ACFP56_18775 [Paenibacillus septentrionalis]|uniref:YhfH family protein n=1 Tax=Paenibacillus septentrionalis TaxID=429342 RepID=A0ABW1V7Q2_9BACL
MTTDVTKNLLTFCFHCENAYQCDTEEKCRDCWADQGIAEKEKQELTTEQLLREYAL